MGFIPGLQGWFNICKSINVIHHINKRKDKNHMILSVDAEKTFDKMQHPLIKTLKRKKKTLKRVRLEKTYLNLTKVIHKRPTAIIILNGGKLKAFPLISGMSNLTTVALHSTESPSLSNETKNNNKRNKRHPNQQRRSETLTLCRQHDTWYVENPKDSTTRWLALTKQFGSVAGYKINAQKSVAFLYTNNEPEERLRSQSNLQLHPKP